MKYTLFTNLILILFCSESVFSDSNSSLVISTTESSEKHSENTQNASPQVNPQIYSMEIHSNISNRFATTLITSKVRNLKNTAEETTFSVILPENAFISQFEMEINDKVYKAYVKEKEEAKKIYEQAVSSGQSAAHVELSARDSKTFKVSVNIEPESKTIFRLTYEELLKRHLGQYELVINIHPGQIVDRLDLQVHINETRPLSFVKTPSLRTGNEIAKNDDKLDPSADIQVINSTSAVVKFSPNVNQQKNFAQLLGSDKESGLAGQFVVQYDVERDPQGGEVLVRDGYFVHFFAPNNLETLPKHVVFVLDHSGSMSGRKIEQLIEAMQNILSELKANDLFNIVRFSSEAAVWNVTEDKFIGFNTRNYGNLEPHLREMNLPRAVEATTDNVKKAKNAIQDQSDMGLTNIIAGLEIGLFLIKRNEESFPDKYEPMIIFLTDGFPNVGMNSGDQITETVTRLNSGKKRASIFSLSFGDGADKDFLRKLSAQNLGFSRHIYEASDASLQLQDFYQQISSPLLSNIHFKYIDGVKDVTKTVYPIFFKGSELVVAGRTNERPSNVLIDVTARSRLGPTAFNATPLEPVSSLERLWAYLTVKEILKERESVQNKTELTNKALDLSLKYSFVTEVSSLVVVKPNQTHSVETQRAQKSLNEFSRAAPVNFQPSSSWSGAYGPPAPQSYAGQPVRAYLFGGSRRFYNSGIQGYRTRIPVSGLYAARGWPSHHRQFFVRPSTVPPPNPPTTTTQPLNAPQWLDDIRSKNGNITTPQGEFLLGKSGDVVTRPSCPKTPFNESGECVIIFDCPEIYSKLTDLNVYLQYFCPLNQYAGVCCPLKTPPIP